MSNGVKDAASKMGAGADAVADAGSGAVAGVVTDAGAGADADADEQCYVLVHGHTEGLALYQKMRAAGVDARIAPAPREAKSACGMALLVPCDQVFAALAAADASGVGYDRVMRVRRRFDAHRDRFC